MDKTFCCSCCGAQSSLNGEKLAEIALHCSHCGRAVKHWSCHRHSCEVLIWAKGCRNYVCPKCTRSEIRVAYDSNDISMLALSLSLELYYKCKRRLISDEDGDMLIELWRKARVSGTDFVRAAAKEAAAVAYRTSESADFIWSASARIEIGARNMMAELARNRSRARARASIPTIPSNASPNSGLTHRHSSRVQTPLITTRGKTGGQKENASASTRKSPMQQHPNLKESIGLRMKPSDLEAPVPSQGNRKRRGSNISKQTRPMAFLCGCRCQ